MDWLRKERPYKDNEHVVGFKEDGEGKQDVDYRMRKWISDRRDVANFNARASASAQGKQDVDYQMRKWISDMRDVLYEAEDIIDNFILKVETEGETKTQMKMGLKDCFEKYFCIRSKNASLIQQANLYGIGHEINTLKTKITQIQQNQETFNIRNIDFERERLFMDWLRKERSYKDNEHVVGFKEDGEGMQDVDYRMRKWISDMRDVANFNARASAQGKKDVDYQMRKWISDMRDVAYEAEDIIDNFILKVEKEGEAKTQKKMGLKDCFEKYFCIRSKNASLIQQANLYEGKQDVDYQMRKWISDMRDVAYEAEDIIDNFILEVETEGEAKTQKKMGLKDCFEKYFCIRSKNASLIQQANLYGIGREINTLKTKITQIQQNQETFNIRNIDFERERLFMDWLRKERSYKDNEHVVGFKEDGEGKQDVDYRMRQWISDMRDVAIFNARASARAVPE
ncbi:hypothetical protein Vadar_025148 [Vaccinium darrowii]|uniref:Uncharacterized protein n=1 Tax=Vaccinium darrowii TaxID=229202 RepID=A0ACB7YYK9_9ERIC|nr:hypothetical protein Vadar_025148 [Vaccinium darrowii]